jgi:hypothetical protein
MVEAAGMLDKSGYFRSMISARKAIDPAGRALRLGLATRIEEQSGLDCSGPAAK